MVALLLILRDCRVAINTLFKHFLRSDRPQLSSACTQNQLSHVPREIFNLKRKRPSNLREQIRNFREEVVRAGCNLLRANGRSKYQHCGGSLQSCAEKNIRFDCKTEMLEWGSPGPGGVKVHASVAPRLICHCAAVKITGSPGSMLAVRIDSNLRQRIRIYEICSKCDIFEKYK